MHDIVAVGCVKLETLALVKLARQVHVENSLSVLLHHQIIVAGLLVKKGLKHHAIGKDVCDLDQRVGAFLILVKCLEELDHHKR